MLSDTSYINGIWSKYNDVTSGKIHDDFFETRVYREDIKENKLLKTVAMFIITILTTIGVVYAGITIYNNLKNKNAYINLNNNMISQQWMNDNFVIPKEEQDMYLASIRDYDEYLEYIEQFKNLAKFTEEEFKNNFVVLICGEEINIESVDADNDTLYINFKSSFTNGDHNVYSLLVPNKQYRENIKLVRKYEKSELTNISFEDISVDYTIEQAIEDGCVVSKNNKIISNNEDDIYEFVEKSKNGENCFIRFVVDKANDMNSKSRMEIGDLEYKDGKYLYKLREIFKDGTEKVNYSNTIFETVEIRKRMEEKVIQINSKDKMDIMVFIFN